MQHAPSVLIPTMSPAEFMPLDGTPGLSALARNMQFELIWCNAQFAAECERPMELMIGSTMHDIMPSEAALEREQTMSRVHQNDTLIAYAQVWHGARWLTRIWPLDPAAFDQPGYFVILQPLTASDVCPLLPSGPIFLMRSSDLGDLKVLTKRELEIFYHLGMGLSQQDIAELLMRSVKTIANHVDRVYKKLGISNRAQLVRMAAERGLIGFSNDEWRELINVAPAKRAV